MKDATGFSGRIFHSLSVVVFYPLNNLLERFDFLFRQRVRVLFRLLNND